MPMKRHDTAPYLLFWPTSTLGGTNHFWKRIEVTHSNPEDDSLDDLFCSHDNALHTLLGNLNPCELGPAADAAYAHINGLVETVRDMTGCLPTAAHIRAYVGQSSDLANDTVASTVQHLISAMRFVPPRGRSDEA